MCVYLYLFVYQNRSNASAECSQVNLFMGHRDGVWHVTHARNGTQVIGTASAGKKFVRFCIYRLCTRTKVFMF